MKNRRLVSTVLFTCFIAFALMFTAMGCSRRDKSESKSKSGRPKTVRVQTVKKGDITEVLDYGADLQPYLEVKIFSPVPDRILTFPWSDGDEIQEGQRIALIRKKGLDMGLEQVSAQIDALDIEIDNLESELKRSKTLFAAGAISQQSFDKIEAALRGLKAQRRALQASKGQVAVSAGNAVIIAPIKGVIANKMLEVGDLAAPQIPLCSIVEIEKLKVQLKLVESDVPKVRVGQAARIRLNAYPQRVFTGAVKKILPYLNSATRTNTVEVVLDNPKDPETGSFLLKPGMFGRAEIEVERYEQVITVDERALILDNQMLEQQKDNQILRKVFVVDGANRVHSRSVKLGVRKGSVFQVIEGLSEGERVVTRGQNGLEDNQKVEIVKALK
ncbi:MAG: efflux RND transporter periplasmic adaptor subunit [Deltaproteobacteria bacterium]|nr:efflux RND transporter periplasmic adaptor subunit [Deltaproteobacteria bacterium]